MLRTGDVPERSLPAQKPAPEFKRRREALVSRICLARREAPRDDVLRAGPGISGNGVVGDAAYLEKKAIVSAWCMAEHPPGEAERVGP